MARATMFNRHNVCVYFIGALEELLKKTQLTGAKFFNVDELRGVHDGSNVSKVIGITGQKQVGHSGRETNL